MPWQEKTTMSLRQEFVHLAHGDEANIRLLCRRFGISPKTGYKWLARVAAEGAAGLEERSRRPQHSPSQTSAAIEEQVLAVRARYPAWGARKLQIVLADTPVTPLPAVSTITAILHRYDQIRPGGSRAQGPFQRFVAPAPNALWQMDFKGHFALHASRCHPLTVLDDHSRFAVGVEACADERAPTVQARLQTIFTRYGLPERMLMDNGPPWGSATVGRWTALTVWLARLGIGISHGRPYHPQTQGKDERFHRTLDEEVLSRQVLLDLAHSQRAFDAWRDTYNLIRPHEALNMRPPARCYQPSPRPFPTTLPEIVYWPGDQVRKVQSPGVVSFHGRLVPVNDAFVGQPVAVRPAEADGIWEIYFCAEKIATLDDHADLLDP
jgi:transposase InsO family protein